MAINVSQAFKRTSANPIDETLALTKAQMLTVNDNLMPSKYFTVCQDDGAVYLYDKTNTSDPTTGKFRLLESGGDIQVDTMPTASADELGKIYQFVGTTTADYTNGYFYKCISDGAVTPTYSWAKVTVEEDEVVEISKADFDALSQAEKDNGKAYFIPDTDIMSNLTVAGFTPIGTIISVMGNTAPRHYLKCEGQVVNISDYPELATYFYDQFGSKNYFGGDGTTTFGIPDLRGEFLRGTGINSHTNNGGGASVGVHQDGTRIPNYGSASTSSSSISGTFFKDASSHYIENADIQIGTASKASFATQSSESANTSAILMGVRPTNTSVLYCIATKNIYMSAENSYSTDEQVVGTWIDGKPLYQKTIVDTFPTISTNFSPVTKYIDVSDLHISYFKLVNSELYMGNGIFDFPCSYQLSGNEAVSYARIYWEDDRLYVQGNKTAMSEQQFIATIQYTKTTD